MHDRFLNGLLCASPNFGFSHPHDINTLNIRIRSDSNSDCQEFKLCSRLKVSLMTIVAKPQIQSSALEAWGRIAAAVATSAGHRDEQATDMDRYPGVDRNVVFHGSIVQLVPSSMGKSWKLIWKLWKVGDSIE